MKTQLTPAVWQDVMKAHDLQWAKMRPELRRYKLAYEQKYWQRNVNEQPGMLQQGLLLIETSRMYEFVEGYQASLFSKAPAVVVKADIRGRGDARVVQSSANYFLSSARTTIEGVSRLANLYPYSVMKLAVIPNKDPYKRVTSVAVPGWDVILDTAASTWETQRYIGHRYWVSVAEAKEKWGAKDYRKMARVDFLDKQEVTGNSKKITEQALPTNVMHQYIQVVEVYDLVDDRLLIWSAEWKDGAEWLDVGNEIEVDGIKRTFDQIPFRTVDDEPVVPMYPLFYARTPEQPLRGLPPARRIYDQCQEINIARTFQANATRKCARQWLMRRGSIDADGLSKISQGVDGEIIEVDPGPGGKLEDIMLPIPQADTPPEVEQYIHQVQSDLDRGNVMAPFTRGQASNGITASEVTALASYSASEIGRLARERDALIENVAKIYVAMLSLYLSDEGNDIVLLDGKVTVMKPSDLQGDFSFFAQDGGATPISEAAHKNDLLQAVPMLQALGVPNDLILKEVVRSLNLPESFIPDETKQQVQPPQGAPQVSGPTTPEPTPDTMLGLAPGSNPGPSRIAAVLPNQGGV